MGKKQEVVSCHTLGAIRFSEFLTLIPRFPKLKYFCNIRLFLVKSGGRGGGSRLNREKKTKKVYSKPAISMPASPDDVHKDKVKIWERG
jgi:hypothetical protein